MNKVLAKIAMYGVVVFLSSIAYGAVQNEGPGHVSMQYLALRELALSAQQLSERTQEEHDLHAQRMQEIILDLRSQLFRNCESIGTVYVLRYDIFTDILKEKIELYETLKHSDLPHDVMCCDELFEQMGYLEVKISDIERTIKVIENKLFTQAAKAHFADIMRRLKRVRDDDFLTRSQLKKDVLFLLKAIADRYHYPLDAVEKIEGYIRDIDKLIATYSYWDSVDYDTTNMMDSGKWEPPVTLMMPSYQTSEMEGWRNYTKTLVNRKNDMRKWNLKTPQNLKDTAPIYHGDTDVKKEFFDRRRDKYRQ